MYIKINPILFKWFCWSCNICLSTKYSGIYTHVSHISYSSYFFVHFADANFKDSCKLNWHKWWILSYINFFHMTWSVSILLLETILLLSHMLSAVNNATKSDSQMALSCHWHCLKRRYKFNSAPLTWHSFNGSLLYFCPEYCNSIGSRRLRCSWITIWKDFSCEWVQAVTSVGIKSRTS